MERRVPTNMSGETKNTRFLGTNPAIIPSLTILTRNRPDYASIVDADVVIVKMGGQFLQLGEMRYRNLLEKS